MKFNPFQHFEIRPDKKHVSELEEKFQIQLPPLFKLFNETFILESFKQPNLDGFWVNYPDEEVGFSDFECSLEFNINNYIEQYAPNEMLSGLMPFATSGIYHNGICVGLEGIYRDKICIQIEINNWEVKVINENIFEFIQDLVYVDHRTDQVHRNTKYTKKLFGPK